MEEATQIAINKLERTEMLTLLADANYSVPADQSDEYLRAVIAQAIREGDIHEFDLSTTVCNFGPPPIFIR